MKRRLCLVLCLVLVMALTACGANSGLSAEEKGEILELMELANSARDSEKEEVSKEPEREEVSKEEPEREEASEESKKEEASEESKKEEASEEEPEMEENHLDVTEPSFIMDGKQITLLETTYEDLQDYGWICTEEIEFSDGTDILESDKYLATKVTLESEKYSNVSLRVGFVNLSDKDKSVLDCDIYSISINILFADESPDIELAGALKWGDSTKEFLEVFGEPCDEYVSDNDFVRYEFELMEDVSLDVVIDGEDGLYEFEFTDTSWR